MRRAARSFASRAQLRAWFERNHASALELEIRLFKVHARHRGVTYREALDEALCFGWIDGVRRALDEDSFTQRFSPRRARSKWSQVNRRRMRELEAAGLLAPAGLAAWRAAGPEPAGYSFESRSAGLAPRYLRQLSAKRKAYDYFQREAPWYRRTSSFYVMSAKREETRQRRLAELISCCERQVRIGVLAGKKR